MSTAEETRKRTERLKLLRAERHETVERTQALLKEQQAVRRKIGQALGDAAHTVPEIAAAAGLPADEVLWHVTAMKKYGLVVETGKSGEYYLYQRVQGAREGARA